MRNLNALLQVFENPIRATRREIIESTIRQFDLDEPRADAFDRALYARFAQHKADIAWMSTYAQFVIITGWALHDVFEFDIKTDHVVITHVTHELWYRLTGQHPTHVARHEPGASDRLRRLEMAPTDG